MATKNGVAQKSQKQSLQPDNGLCSKTVQVFQEGDVLWIRVETDRVVQDAGRSGINKRTGQKWEQIHPLLARIGQSFGNGLAWFGDMGIMLKVVQRGESASVKSVSLPDWAK